MLLKLAFSLVAMAIGASFAVQTSINAGLARGMGSAILAALTSFGVGSVTLVVLALATGQFQVSSSARDMPIWMWLSGGILGAGIVFGSLYLVPRIGVAALAAFIIAGQLAVAALIDHFGFFGVPVHEIGLWRILGIVMLFAGALLVRFN